MRSRRIVLTLSEPGYRILEKLFSQQDKITTIEEFARQLLEQYLITLDLAEKGFLVAILHGKQKNRETPTSS